MSDWIFRHPSWPWAEWHAEPEQKDSAVAQEVDKALRFAKLCC